MKKLLKQLKSAKAIALCALLIAGKSYAQSGVTAVQLVKPIGCSKYVLNWVEQHEKKFLGKLWTNFNEFGEPDFMLLKHDFKKNDRSSALHKKYIVDQQVKYFLHQDVIETPNKVTIIFTLEDIYDSKNGSKVIGIFQGDQTRFGQWFKSSIVGNIEFVARGNPLERKKYIYIGCFDQENNAVYELSRDIEDSLLLYKKEDKKLTDKFIIVLCKESEVARTYTGEKIDGKLISDDMLQVSYNKQRISFTIPTAHDQEKKRGEQISKVSRDIIARLPK